jgi:tRNA A-37 threonylcarbamoyl transferase component Bud32
VTALPLADAPAAAAPVAWSSLAILAPLGTDHFGAVYRARDPELDREVTLHLRPAAPDDGDAREAHFVDEARRFARIRHPGVQAVHGAGRRDGWLGRWSEPVSGRTLEEHLCRDGPLSPGEVRRLGLEVCQALAAIHATGVIHREVRTTGVMREETGRIVLMDSGALGDLPRRREDETPDRADALDRALAPERLVDGSVSLSTDVYGLGALLYRLVSGHDPVETDSLAELTDHHRRRSFVPLRERRPGLPLDLARVIEKAIESVPARRYPNMAAFERALAGTLMPALSATEGEPGEAADPGPVVRWLERWRSTVSAAAALAFGCAIAVMLIAEPSPSRIASLPAGPMLPEVLPTPPLTGPPAPAHLAGASRYAGAPRPAEEPEEQWTYKPVTREVGYGPPLMRTPHAAPSRPAQQSGGAVAGATAMLRALARGPAMASDTPAFTDSSAYLTLRTDPERARVSIDGVVQREPTNATYALEPGDHIILIEKPGYAPQELPPVHLGPGQKMRAGVTLAVSRPDSTSKP